MPALRYATHFENEAGTKRFDFPLTGYEYNSEQELRLADAAILGDYQYDFLTGAAPKGASVEAVRFLLPEVSEAQIDAMLGALIDIGRGRLWVRLQDGTKRWREARVTGLPSVIRSYELQDFYTPIEIQFRGYTNWRSETKHTGSFSVNSSPHNFTITMPGNAEAKTGIFIWRANAAGGITNPQLENLTTAASVSTSRDSASADSALRLSNDRWLVEFSSDNGANWANDYSLVTIPATQKAPMNLLAGANSMRLTCGGTPDYNFEYEVWPEWH